MGEIPLRGDYSRPTNVLTITVLPLATPLEQDDGLVSLRLMFAIVANAQKVPEY
jgi:hypothetical protein